MRIARSSPVGQRVNRWPTSSVAAGFDDSICTDHGSLEQVCWATTYSVCAPRCDFYGGDSFCMMIVPDAPRCNRTTGECTD